MSHAARTNESCRTYEWVVNESRRTYEWFMTESVAKDIATKCITLVISMSHVALTDAPYRPYDWVIYMNESHRTHEWVMTESVAKDIATKCITIVISMCHVAHVDESCCPYAWVMSPMWMSDMKESRRTYEWVMMESVAKDIATRSISRVISMSLNARTDASYHSHEWVL